MFGAVGSAFGRVFGTEKAVDNLMDKDKGLLVRMGGWVNDMSYTDQEKAKADADTREWGIRQLAALEPFKIVQRILAFGISFLWAITGINVLVGIWVEALYPDTIVDGVTQEGIKVVEPLLSFAFSDYLLWPTTICFALYFGGGTIGSFVSRKTEKNK